MQLRLRFFIIIVAGITLLSLAYTWQETEIIKLAYQENQKTRDYKELLDKNRALRYNLVSLKSSSNLGAKLFNDNTEFEIPRSTQMFVVPLPKKENVNNSQGALIKDGIILGMFKIKEAWPVSLVKSYLDKQAQAQDLLNK